MPRVSGNSVADDGVIADLFVIGGGINGCGIARDAAGRGLSVVLAEKNDLAGATSSASTKLFHGGLRYLEYFEVRLVQESLEERETLLRAMPHISWPLRFVLPYHQDMRFDNTTPTARFLNTMFPWTRGKRPSWLIRFGLFMYDNLGGRKILPPTASINLKKAPEGVPLQERFAHAFEYSDCWVEDSRLVVLNARDAEARGAKILTRTEVVSARREGKLWEITVLEGPEQTERVIHARALVNAGGPWVSDILRGAIHVPSNEKVRLVRGSHIVTRRLYEHDKCYFFQGTDGRIIFAIPYERDFTLIGTTDVDHPDASVPAVCTEEEQEYLCTLASTYFRKPVTRADIVWTYSGVRPLYDSGADNASAATRDYTLTVDSDGPPLLNVFGGKITTYRRLAQSALRKLSPFLPSVPGDWTAGVPLPGGDFPVNGRAALVAQLRAEFRFLDGTWADRLVRAYGTECWAVLGGARSAADLGIDFGATLTEREVEWLVTREYARTADDILWRRSKLGLRMSSEETEALEDWLGQRLHRRAYAGGEHA